MSGLSDALAYVGGSIDKPGRAVRGLLGGKPREALAAIPFSDTMGLTDPHDRVSGRNLTDAIGLTRTGDQGWGSWALGSGAEMLTDPLNMIPAHSVFKAMHEAGHFDNFAPALKGFMASESGAARIPKPKLPTYDLAPVEGAQAARGSYRMPKGAAIEQVPGRPRYNMKPGPAPRQAPIEPLPHELPSMPTQQPAVAAPVYGPEDDLVAAYNARRQQIHLPESPQLEPYVPEPSGGGMRFLNDWHQTAQQAAVNNVISSVPEAARTPSLMRRLREMLGGGVTNYGG